MRIFYAGEGYEDVQSRNKANVLISFYYMDYKKRHTDLKKKWEWSKLFIDSGAFTAWSQGCKINIDQYINYIKMNFADHYAVLDVIGSAEGTYKNQKYMESKGVTPIPCFHYGEDWKWLDLYCKNYDYVCLGGMVPISTPELIKWLDVVFAKYPKQKFHGFGLTSPKLLRDYPWHTVDSSTWIMHMKYNEISSPFVGQLYLGKNKEDSKKIVNNLKNLKWVELIKGYGWNPEDLFDNYRLRTEFNLKEFQRYEKWVNENKPWKVDFQNSLEVDYPKLNIPKFDKPKEGVQMNLLNMSLGRVKPVINYYVKCVECGNRINTQRIVNNCPKCGSASVTSPQEVMEAK